MQKWEHISYIGHMTRDWTKWLLSYFDLKNPGG